MCKYQQTDSEIQESSLENSMDRNTITAVFTDELHLVAKAAYMFEGIDTNLTDEEYVEEYKWEYVGVYPLPPTTGKWFGYDGSFWLGHLRET
jgi:hypothetical protein